MDLEKAWWDAFGDSYGVEFEKARPDYSRLDKRTRTIGALMKLELDMYNGGFVQFFCNWGHAAYLLALEGLEHIQAAQAKALLQQAYNVIAAHENDTRIGQLWDLATMLTKEETRELERLDQLYWQDADGVMAKMLDTYAKTQ